MAMKSVSTGAILIGLTAFVVLLFLPANSDWLGFFWAAFSLEVVVRGPRGVADYPLFLIVSVGNLLALLAPLAFVGARAWGTVVAHLLVATTIAAAVMCFYYHPTTWAVGYYTWCGALAVLAVSIYLRAASPTGPVLRPAPVPQGLGALRRSRPS